MRLLAIVLALLAPAAVAQSWMARVGVGGTNASAQAVAELPSGGVIVASWESSLGWLFEIGPGRDLRWQARVQDDGGTFYARALVALPDGSVIAAGAISESASTTRTDAALVRLDASRAVAWAVTCGVPGTSELFADMVLRPNGTLALIGSAPNSPFVVVAGADGSLVSQVRWSVAAPDAIGLERIAAIGTSDVVIAGWIMTPNPSGNQNFDVLIARANPASGPSWQVALGEFPQQETQARVSILTGGDILAAMLTEQAPAEAGRPKVCLTRMSPGAGTIRWSRCLDQQAYSATLAPSADGGIVVGGHTWLAGPSRDEAYAFRLDATGATQAQLFFGTDLLDQGISMLRPLSSGGYVAAGKDGPLALVMAFDDSLLPPVECAVANEPGAGIVPGPTAFRSPGVTTGNPGLTFVARPLAIVETALGIDPPCGAPLPPLEVSPRGSASPLLWTSKMHLTWEEGSASLSDTFDVHRGALAALRAGDYGACFATGVAVPELDDAELPGAPGFFYLVGGRNAAGRGTLGFRSDGIERMTPTPCP